MSTPSLKHLTNFVLAQLQAQPLASRALLLRDLALLAGSEVKAKRLLAQADELDAIEARHQQLLLDFKQGPARPAARRKS